MRRDAQQLVAHHVQRRQEAVLLAVEQLEEGVDRHARLLSYLGCAQVGVVLSHRQPQRVVQQSLAVALLLLLRVGPVDTVVCGRLAHALGQAGSHALGHPLDRRRLEEQRPAQHLLGQLGSLHGRSLAQAHRHRSVQTAGDPPHDRRRQGARLGRFRKALRQQLLARGRRPMQVRQARRAGRLGLHHHQHAGLAVDPRGVCQLSHGRPQAVLQAAARSQVSLAELLDAPACKQVEGRQEALLLVGELLVEGAARDTRQGHHLLDARLLIAAACHRLHHRPVDARALVAHDLAAVQAVGTVREALVQGHQRRRAVGSSKTFVPPRRRTTAR